SQLVVQRATRAVGCRATPPHRQPPASRVAVVPAGDSSAPLLAAAPRTDSPRRCWSQSSPSATAQPAARPARTPCSSAPRPPPGQRPTAPPTTSGAAGTVPPRSRPGRPGRAGGAGPAELGAGLVVAATPSARTPLLESDRVAGGPCGPPAP